MLPIATRSALLAVLALAAAGCGLLRSAPSDAERLAETARRLAEAPTDSARTAVAVALLREAGLTPVAGDRFEYGLPGAGRVVAGFVPGRAPLARDTLVVVAASIAGADAAVLAEAARRLVEAADQTGADPGRSVLVALWSTDFGPALVPGEVLAFPLWPRGAVRQILLVGGPPTDAGTVSASGVPAEVVSSGPVEPLTPERLATRIVAAARATAAYGQPAIPAAPEDSVQTPTRN